MNYTLHTIGFICLITLFISCIKSEDFYDDFSEHNKDIWDLKVQTDDIYDTIENGLLKIKSYNPNNPLNRTVFVFPYEVKDEPFVIETSIKIDTINNSIDGLYWGDCEHIFYVYGFKKNQLYVYKMNELDKSETKIYELSREIDMQKFHTLALKYNRKKYSLLFDEQEVIVDDLNKIDYAWSEFSSQFGFYTNSYIEADYISKKIK